MTTGVAVSITVTVAVGSTVTAGVTVSIAITVPIGSTVTTVFVASFSVSNNSGKTGSFSSTVLSFNNSDGEVVGTAVTSSNNSGENGSIDSTISISNESDRDVFGTTVTSSTDSVGISSIKSDGEKSEDDDNVVFGDKVESTDVEELSDKDVSVIVDPYSFSGEDSSVIESEPESDVPDTAVSIVDESDKERKSSEGTLPRVLVGSPPAHTPIIVTVISRKNIRINGKIFIKQPPFFPIYSNIGLTLFSSKDRSSSQSQKQILLHRTSSGQS